MSDFTDSLVDGLPARAARQWTMEKLFYVERYLAVFATAMKDKWHELVYVDLLAGPGRCVIEETGKDIPGSPLLATARTEFGRLFLNDIDPIATVALARRTGR